MLQGEFFKNLSVHNLIRYSIYNQYSMIARDMYQWDGLENFASKPNPERLEHQLFNTGKVALYNSETEGWILLSCAPSDLNYQGEYQRFDLFGLNGRKQAIGNPSNTILIKNNIDMYPSASIVAEYAKALSTIYETMTVNLNAIRTPVMVLTDTEKDKLAMQLMYKQFAGESPVIFADKNRYGGSGTITAIKTDAPYQIDKLYVYYQQMVHELQTILGINNNEAFNKKERNVASEPIANNEITALSGNLFLSERQKAAKEISDRTGVDVTVRKKTIEGVIILDDSTDSGNGDSFSGEVYGKYPSA